MIERIPEDLIVLDTATDGLFTMAVAALEVTAARGRENAEAFHWPLIVVPGRTEQDDCLVLVKNSLAGCPDQAPSKSTRGLLFLPDAHFRELLLVDLGTAERALNNGEWKATMVLGGSLIEALLLWAIEQHSEPERSSAMGRALASGRLIRNLQINDLTAWEWSLHPYIEVAYELGEIKEHTANSCREAKYYRNLIHPAAVERDKEKCTRGKAHGALGAVYSTIEDLEEKHPSAV